MLEQIRTSLQDAGTAIYEILAWPGKHLLLEISKYWPHFANQLTSQDSGVLFIFLASLVYWFLVIVAVKLLLAFIRDLLRIINSFLHTLMFYIANTYAGIRTTLICRFRGRINWRKSHGEVQTADIQFDNLEIAIMKVAAAKGPGFALAAPDIAEKLRLRPGQAQNILDKLCQYKMMEPAIGTTDGFDNYRLTNSGNAFMAIVQRQVATSAIRPQKQLA